MLRLFLEEYYYFQVRGRYYILFLKNEKQKKRKASRTTCSRYKWQRLEAEIAPPFHPTPNKKINFTYNSLQKSTELSRFLDEK